MACYSLWFRLLLILVTSSVTYLYEVRFKMRTMAGNSLDFLLQLGQLHTHTSIPNNILTGGTFVDSTEPPAG